jgi:hypothetical protein
LRSSVMSTPMARITLTATTARVFTTPQPFMARALASAVFFVTSVVETFVGRGKIFVSSFAPFAAAANRAMAEMPVLFFDPNIPAKLKGCLGGTEDEEAGDGAAGV